VTFTLDGVSMDFQGNYGDAVHRARPSRARSALAVRIGGAILPLGAIPREGDTAATVTYQDTEGRRVYERTLRFVFILAIARLFPEMLVRLEHSFGHGIYVHIHGGAPLTCRMIGAIEREMRAIVESDLPFTEVALPREEAIEYFKSRGQIDRARLLRNSTRPSCTLVECIGHREHRAGVTAPSTGYVGVFSLMLYLPGMMLQMPDPEHPERVAPFRDLPKLMQTYAESVRWASILDCSNVDDLNAMLKRGKLREFVRVNEALHEKSINRIAEQYYESGARVILIAGPSSSGKTTFANRLAIALRVMGLRPMKLSLDDYYIDRERIPLDEHGERDYERLDTLDVPLFNEHLARLLQSDQVETAIFDFRRGERRAETSPLHIGQEQPIIIEGIHGLNDALTVEIARNMKYKVYISALTTLNLDEYSRIRTTDARLLLRMARDFHFRGTPPERTLSMWPSVRRGEETYIFPFQEQADVMFNSSLVYEMTILKTHVYPMLTAVTPDHPQYALAERLAHFLSYFLTAQIEDEIPPNSILREFIGGGCFEREGSAHE